MTSNRLRTVTDKRWPRWVYGVGEEPDARFSFANERTFLAWIRTGLGFVTAAVAVTALVALKPELRLEAVIASLVLAVCGVACGISAFLGWARNERQLRLSKPLPSSPVMPLLVIVMVIVAVIAVVLVVP